MMIASKHLQFVIVFLGSLLAVYVGSNIVTLPPAGLFIVGAVIFLGIWMLVAGKNWWVTIFAGGTIGGIFHVGFKVYPNEIAFALAVIGLVPLVLVQDRKVFETQRKPLPFIFYLTALFIAIRLLIDVIPAQGARGNMSRILFDQTWCFAFAFLFHHYGSLSAARTAIGLMFVFLLIRTVAALIGFMFNVPLIIPGRNYVLSFSAHDSLIPMRYVAFMLLTSALILFHSTRSIIYRAALLPVFAFACILVVMGEGRFATLVMLMLPTAFCAWSRRWALLFLVGTLSVGTILFINAAPDTLNSLPRQAGRALSGLVFSKNASQEDFETEASDHWHQALREEGYKRWTSSPADFLFGDGITPSFDLYDQKKFKEDPETAVKNGANIGGYESGLWSVVGLFGVVGFGLYLLLFIRLRKDVLPYFFRRPKGTFWEGIVFWGCYSAITWYLVCYFQGYSPEFEMLLMIIAWETVNEGKLDEKEPEPIPAPAPYLSMRMPEAIPVRARV